MKKYGKFMFCRFRKGLRKNVLKKNETVPEFCRALEKGKDCIASINQL